MNPPPTTPIPAPPPGYTAPPPRAFSGSYPDAHELLAAPGAIQDLQSFQSYTQQMGASAPDQDAVANAIQLGVLWSAQRIPAETWNAYVRAQYGAAWKAAFTLLEELKPLFLSAVSKTPSLALEYPGLAAMFVAPRTAAAKSLATKKKNAKTKASAAGPATPTVSASTATGAADPATSAPAPTKSITVTA